MTTASAEPRPTRSDLIMQLGKALHAAGSPSHRIEEGLSLVAQRLGLASHFFSTPTALFAAIDDGTAQVTRLERVEPGGVDLDRLSALDQILEDLVAGRESLDAVEGRLQRVAAGAPGYSPPVTILGFALASGSAAVLFGGGWPEVWGSFGVGVVTGLLAWLTARSPTASRLFEPIAAVGAATIAGALATLLGGLSPTVIILAGLIVLLPGLSLTVAVNELATRQLVSGSARFAGAMVVFFGLAFGVALGTFLAASLFGAGSEEVHTPLGPLAAWLAVPVAALGLTVLFRARPTDYLWVLVAGLVATQGVVLGIHLAGPLLGPFVGALLVGMTGNLLARWRRRPAALVHLPGLILLVPGSLGLRSLSFLLEREVLAGVTAAFETSFVAMAITAGLLLANLMAPPRRIL